MGETRATVLAGVLGTGVVADVAVLPCESEWAGTRVVINAIRTGAGVETGAGGTIVDVYLTVDTSKSRATVAFPAVTKVYTLAAISTGISAAVVRLPLTVGSCVACGACTDVAPILLCTRSAVKTRLVGTLQFALLTVLPGEPLRTATRVVMHQVITAPAVPAWIAVTAVDLDFTAVPGEAFLARARVTALACVGAGGPVPARLVVGAKVEVLVAEQAAPALLAVALPRLTACAVQTVWVATALVTSGAFPAQSTRTLPGLLTEAMVLATARRTYGFCAVVSFPSWQTHSDACRVAGKMPKRVVAWTTKR